ncbi:peptidase S74, partial [Escherichia coli]|nr:peptidase S74 [Escherichia coli]
ELFKITDTPWYNAWTQDKTFVYDNVIYAPFMAGDRHGVNNLHVAWVRSGDDGKTWTTPEWLTDLHENYPTVNYHCMSMGVVRNRLFAVIETRTVSGNKLQVAELWDRPMSRSLRVYGGITKAANQQVAYIRITDHGLFAGDFVNFSNSGVTGVTGNMTVTTVIDKNTFTVTTQNTQDVDQNNEGRYWSFGTSFHSSPWRKTSLGTIPSFVDGSTPVTEIHSFATISDNSFAVGYHNGDIGPRELGILYFSDAFGSPGSFVRRRIPAEYEANASEPCVKYYDGILYLTTRGTLSTQPGSSLHRSSDLGTSWNSLRFPNNVHHSNLPFAKVGDELIIFGSERAFGEWEGGEPDNRYAGNYPRTFMTRVNVNEWSLDNVEWVNVTDQIYQGGIVNSA